ncbi:MAG: hypothetical protein JWN70_1386 [Planctomycetaceae bacterium]|nr:hypothetical protein [Planctomycetaceae bacterium]
MTIGPNLTRLLELSVGASGLAAPTFTPGLGCLGDELGALLAKSNGFVAFESALRVRGQFPGEGGLHWWNEGNTWRSSFGGMTDGAYFFAEDIFGNQFGLRGQEVVSFDPEVGESAHIASSLDSWAEQLLMNFELLTGYPLAHAWQRAFFPLQLGSRLVPITPFVLGGEFAVDNLRVVTDVAGMRSRAALAVQIRDLPDGTPIQLDVQP